MSQPKKLDIADFFRANARSPARPPPIVPQKRPTPDLDDDGNDDTIVVRQKLIDTTPSSARFVDHEASRINYRTPTKASAASLTTPKSGRSISIPFRSPSGTTDHDFLSSKAAFLFNTSQKSPQSSPAATDPTVFNDVPSSSRKVIEDGKLVAVRDSDESDNESLGSLTDLLERKANESPSSSAAQATSLAKAEGERIRLLSMYTGGRSNPIVNRERMRALQRREKEIIIDLSSVIDEDRKEEETRARLAQIEAELEQSTRDIQEGKQKELDKKLLASILQGGIENNDPDELGRLMNAVDRTEALSGDKLFCFFGQTGPRDLTEVPRTKRAFPASAIPASLWQPRDIAARNRTYLSGFMTELAYRNRLSDQALRWTYDSMLYEPDEELRQAYLSCVAAASSVWTRANITPEDIQDVFVALGAEQTAVRDSATIESKKQLGNTNQKVEYCSLLHTLLIFDTICQDMDFPTLSKLVSLIVRLCLDHKVMIHNQTMQAVESLLRKLADLSVPSSRQHIHERVLFDLGSNMTEPTLQAQFLMHFAPASAAGMKLRTTLAAIFLLGSTRAAKLLKPNATKPPLPALLSHITMSPAFKITSETDFQSLAARVVLLDITISSGHSPTPNTRIEENAFNAQVDDLADKIHDLFTSIADAGASHLKKTEAKDALQALHNRLLFAVRTRIRRKKHIFDKDETNLDRWRVQEADDITPGAEGSNFMQRLAKQHGSKKETDQSANVLEA